MFMAGTSEKLPRACKSCHNRQICEMSGDPLLPHDLTGDPTPFKTPIAESVARQFSSRCVGNVCGHAQLLADYQFDLNADIFKGQTGIPLDTTHHPFISGVGKYIDPINGEIFLVHPKKGRVVVGKVGFRA